MTNAMDTEGVLTRLREMSMGLSGMLLNAGRFGDGPVPSAKQQLGEIGWTLERSQYTAMTWRIRRGSLCGGVVALRREGGENTLLLRSAEVCNDN